MSTKTTTTLRKISRGYQITLPPEFREKAGLSIGDHVRIEQVNDQLIITAVNDKRQQLANELMAVLSEPVADEAFASEEDALQFAIEQVKRYRKKAKRKPSPQNA